jgi:phage tail sheath gpL-like
MGSNAVSQNAVSTVLGYLLSKGYFNPSSPNLPQNITILGEANTANQTALVPNIPVQITSAKQAATLYGYGSPIHAVARILFPQTGGQVSVPVWVSPQAAAVGSVAQVITITTTGTATAAGTIYLNVAGREVLDGGSYAVAIAVGDTPTVVANKMRSALSSVLGCPVIGSGTTTCVCTAKWTGLTSNDITITVDAGSTATGCTFAVVQTTPGSGTPTTATALTNFGNAWNTIIINTYGLVGTIMAELEAYNGIPDPVNPTGQFAGTIMRPMFAFSGTTLDNPTSITGAGARPNNVTIVTCPAPLSPGMPYEAAANFAVLWANVAQNAPHSDIIEQALPDMPPPPAGSIPAMNAQVFREQCVANGCSTVSFSAGVYKVKDFITTYNLAGELPPFYRYVRDLNVHFNYKFGYHLKEVQSLVGKTLVPDSAVVRADNVIKPSMWASIVAAYNQDCEARALIVNTKGNNKTIVSTINSTNPNRLDTTQSIQISGITRIAATTVTGGFYFGGA